ncbi:hypothetical protein JYU34_011005, partial [Plutella xylostella]
HTLQCPLAREWAAAAAAQGRWRPAFRTPASCETSPFVTNYLHLMSNQYYIHFPALKHSSHISVVSYTCINAGSQLHTRSNLTKEFGKLYAAFVGARERAPRLASGKSARRLQQKPVRPDITSLYHTHELSDKRSGYRTLLVILISESKAE